MIVKEIWDIHTKFDETYCQIKEFLIQNLFYKDDIEFLGIYSKECYIEEDNTILFNFVVRVKSSTIYNTKDDSYVNLLLQNISIKLSPSIFVHHKEVPLMGLHLKKSFLYHNYHGDCALIDAINYKHELLLKINKNDFDNHTYYSFNQIDIKIDDEFGKIAADEFKLDHIDINNISESLLLETFDIAGISYHAPHTNTSNTIHCILYAETENPHDIYAIKLYRWIPNIKESRKKLKNDLIFDLAYISKRNNRELHNYMIETNSRVLFGTLKNGNIKILGGIKEFVTSPYLSQYNVPNWVLNII